MKLVRHTSKSLGARALPRCSRRRRAAHRRNLVHAAASDLPLLAKYIFTSERLSVQVHPERRAGPRARPAAAARANAGTSSTREPGATLGLGLKREVGKDELRAAALDGSIEQLMDWQPVRAGDFFFVPAGTIHAIGAGISLLEFQQNIGHHLPPLRLRPPARAAPRRRHRGRASERASPTACCSISSAREARTLVDGPHFTLVAHDAGCADRIGSAGSCRSTARCARRRHGRPAIACCSEPGDDARIRPAARDC